MQCHELFIHVAQFENVQGFTQLRNKQKTLFEHVRLEQMAQQTKTSSQT